MFRIYIPFLLDVSLVFEVWEFLHTYPTHKSTQRKRTRDRRFAVF